jgi:hypothetical protein
MKVARLRSKSFQILIAVKIGSDGKNFCTPNCKNLEASKGKMKQVNKQGKVILVEDVNQYVVRRVFCK